MKLESIYDRGIKFHHYCNTAYPLRPNSLAQYEVHDNTAIREVIKKNIEEQDKLCLYVHVPFCQSRCKFCEYVVLDKPEEGDADNYVEHLLKEIELICRLKILQRLQNQLRSLILKRICI